MSIIRVKLQAGQQASAQRQHHARQSAELGDDLPKILGLGHFSDHSSLFKLRGVSRGETAPRSLLTLRRPWRLDRFAILPPFFRPAVGPGA